MPIIQLAYQTLLDALRRLASCVEAVRTGPDRPALLLRSRGLPTTCWQNPRKKKRIRDGNGRSGHLRRPERLGRRRLLVRPLAHLVHRRWRDRPAACQEGASHGGGGSGVSEAIDMAWNWQCEPACRSPALLDQARARGLSRLGGCSCRWNSTSPVLRAGGLMLLRRGCQQVWVLSQRSGCCP